MERKCFLLQFEKYLSLIEEIGYITEHCRYNNYRDHVYGYFAAPFEMYGLSSNPSAAIALKNLSHGALLKCSFLYAHV